jgi:hypothetical protein
MRAHTWNLYPSRKNELIHPCSSLLGFVLLLPISIYSKEILLFGPRREPPIIFLRISLFQPIISGF